LAPQYHVHHSAAARVELRSGGSGIESLSSLITSARLQVGPIAARTFSKASASLSAVIKIERSNVLPFAHSK
jgi:hypothetical protein